MMQRFSDVVSVTKNDALKAFESGITADICNALVSVAFHERDWQWAQDRFLELLASNDPSIGGLAATCLGHIARIHRTLDKERVLRALNARRADPEIGGCVEDAIDDITAFT